MTKGPMYVCAYGKCTIHTHTYTYTYTCIHTYIHTDMSLVVHAERDDVCVGLWKMHHTYTHIYIHIHIHTYTQI